VQLKQGLAVLLGLGLATNRNNEPIIAGNLKNEHNVSAMEYTAYS